MKREPLVSAARKARAAYRNTPRGELHALLAEQSKWKRRLTIASNKLEVVRNKIDMFAWEQSEVKNEPNPPKTP